MFLKKTACLLLTLVFMCTVAVPALAGGDPPGTGGEIHPWDNNDEVRPGGPMEIARRTLFVGYGFNGRHFILPAWGWAGVVKAFKSSNAKAIPQSPGSLKISTRNR